MNSKRNRSLGNYVDRTDAALSTPPEQRNSEQARLVRIVEKSPTYNSIFGKGRQPILPNPGPGKK